MVHIDQNCFRSFEDFDNNPANQSTKSAEATFQNSKATWQDSIFRK